MQHVVNRATIAGGAFAVLLVLVLLALPAGRRAPEPDADPAAATAPVAPIPPAGEATEAEQGFLYGRVTTDEGVTYEGRLRFGGGEEAFWSDTFNGAKATNPWAAHVAPERLPTERLPFKLFGVELAVRERAIDLARPFMARFGDIARIDADGRDLRVTLKSGTVFALDRWGADDFADGVRVWDARQGEIDLGERRMRTIELLPTPRLDAVPERLHGTVRTRDRTFTGYVQWDREECVGSDELDGFTLEREQSLRFDTIRSIARRADGSALVSLLDGPDVVLSGTNDVGPDNRGIHVDDPRYGRVLVSWDAFERVDFSPAGSGPAYGDFPPGRPLTGSVTTRDGRRFTGRLVYDLDESETTETLDAPARGVDYTLPFGRIASIVLPGLEQDARVRLHDGEELQLERSGDLGAGNLGMLVFAGGGPSAEYVPWAEIERIELDRAPATDPPADGG